MLDDEGVLPCRYDNKNANDRAMNVPIAISSLLKTLSLSWAIGTEEWNASLLSLVVTWWIQSDG